MEKIIAGETSCFNGKLLYHVQQYSTYALTSVRLKIMSVSVLVKDFVYSFRSLKSLLNLLLSIMAGPPFVPAPKAQNELKTASSSPSDISKESE